MGTSVEKSRTSYIGRSRGFGLRGTGYIVGPVLVEHVVTQTTRDDGTVCDPTYSVEIDGQHVFGGFERHVEANGLAVQCYGLLDLSPVVEPKPETKTYRVPRIFFDDHEARDLPSGTVVRRNDRFVYVDMTDDEAAELLSDARYYDDDALRAEARYEQNDFLLSICGSARSTVAALVKQGVVR